jgi:hypothetical protein
MPRASFIKEHKKLLKVLKRGDPKELMKEHAEQKAELEAQLKGGRGRASGFIMRMMAENKLKHKGQYKNPTKPLAPESTMNKPVAFDLDRLANESQRPGGTNKKDYGASPFIMKHFGSEKAVRFVPRSQRGKTVAEEPEDQETNEQKEARLRIEAEGLLAKAAELAAASKGKKIAKFAKDRLKISEAKAELATLKKAKAAADEDRRRQEEYAQRIRESERKRIAEREERQRVLLAEVAEKKRIEAEEKEEQKKRESALKEVAKDGKSKVKGFGLPKWWDGIQCVRAWAKRTDHEKRWFGKMLYIASNEYYAPELTSLKRIPVGRKETSKESNARIAADKEIRLTVEDSLLELGERYAKWLFTLALPNFGYDLIEVKPKEDTFPQEDGNPSGLRMTINKYGEKNVGYKPGSEPPALPETMTLLVHPNKKLAWLISVKQGDERWKALSRKMMADNTAGNGGFSFSAKFQIVPRGSGSAKKLVHIVDEKGSQMVGDIEITKDTHNSQTLLGSNPPVGGTGYDKHVDWAYPEGLAEITKDLFDNLNARKAWSGTPLTNIDLSD